MQVNVQEAKTRLSELLARVERGEPVVIARNGRPVAELSAVAPPSRRQFTVLEGFSVPDDFDDPLPEEELARWD